MQETPKGLRTHIGIYGRRNVGKSSLLNALTGQAVSIVSPTPGTTTDPVEKTMELLPIGPVVFLDTAGVDDEGALGEQRRARTYRTVDRTDVALLVTDGRWGMFERDLAALFRERRIPCCVVCSKSDAVTPEAGLAAELEREGLSCVSVSSLTGDGLPAVRAALARMAAEADAHAPLLLGDVVPAGALVLLVVPVDTGAPKGRLILPQVQAIRDLLDAHCLCMVVTDEELPAALDRVSPAPDLVVCDSQVVRKVAACTPDDVPMTTFSILMARFKGDLETLARGAAAMLTLKPGDSVLIGEACSHHPFKDDIGRVKLPRWLREFAGGDLRVDMAAGKELNADIAAYRLIVHCGGCVITRRHMLRRLEAAVERGVPITNYGVAISLTQGVLERVLRPFPAALAAYQKAAASGAAAE
ncbi:MAG: [FeFe] hydrogenase H-cluster maturation GTPase HydF [Desulfovibrionaceae bacterium]